MPKLVKYCIKRQIVIKDEMKVNESSILLYLHAVLIKYLINSCIYQKCFTEHDEPRSIRKLCNFLNSLNYPITYKGSAAERWLLDWVSLTPSSCLRLISSHLKSLAPTSSLNLNCSPHICWIWLRPLKILPVHLHITFFNKSSFNLLFIYELGFMKQKNYIFSQLIIISYLNK